MTIDDDNFTVALRDLADRHPVAAAPTARVLQRARRAHRARTTTMTAAALAVVTAAGGIALGLDRRDATPSSATPSNATSGTVTAGTPALELVAAVRASTRTSFRFQVTSAASSVESGKEKALWQRAFTGAYDPRVPKGYSTWTGGDGQRRIIGEAYYVQKGDRWWQSPVGPGSSLISFTDHTGLLDPMATVDFADQFAALTEAGTVRRTSATSYAFQFSWRPDPRLPHLPSVIPVAGTITIDAKSRLVTAMSYDYTFADPRDKTEFRNAAHWTYSDYGRPVEVEVPPNPTKVAPPK